MRYIDDGQCYKYTLYAPDMAILILDRGELDTGNVEMGKVMQCLIE